VFRTLARLYADPTLTGTNPGPFPGDPDRYPRRDEVVDYLTAYTDLFPKCSPIARQLLGDIVTPMGVYLPADEDVPLGAVGRGDLLDPRPDPGRATHPGMDRPRGKPGGLRPGRHR